MDPTRMKASRSASRITRKLEPKAERGALKSICTLLAPLGELWEEVALALDDAHSYAQRFRRRMALRGVDESEKSLARLALVDGLIARKLLAEVDWRADPKEVSRSLGRLATKPEGLKRLFHPLPDVIPTDELLELVGGRLRERGVVLVAFDLHTDSYPLLFLNARSTLKAQRLAPLAGYRGITVFTGARYDTLRREREQKRAERRPARKRKPASLASDPWSLLCRDVARTPLYLGGTLALLACLRHEPSLLERIRVALAHVPAKDKALVETVVAMYDKSAVTIARRSADPRLSLRALTFLHESHIEDRLLATAMLVDKVDLKRKRADVTAVFACAVSPPFVRRARRAFLRLEEGHRKRLRGLAEDLYASPINRETALRALAVVGNEDSLGVIEESLHSAAWEGGALAREAAKMIKARRL
jgi:hypothetical protein